MAWHLVHGKSLFEPEYEKIIHILLCCLQIVLVKKIHIIMEKLYKVTTI